MMDAAISKIAERLIALAAELEARRVRLQAEMHRQGIAA